jgi:predicted TIM-barrel fold metal-dependent hydrolase
MNHEPSWPRNNRLGNLLDSNKWQQGFSTLAQAGYSFDLQCNPHQYKQAAQIFQRNPKIPVILNHLGTPKREDLLEGQKYWEGLQALANLEQVSIKLSMLTYPNKHWHQDSLIKETVNKVIDLFGFQRCIFASNYPVEKLEGWDAQSMYQEFQKLVDHRRQEEQDALFALNAMRIYRA